MLTAFDHAFAALVFVIYPVYSALTIKSTLREIAAGGEAALVGAYRQIIVTWLLFGLLVLGFWFHRDRAWAELGLLLDVDGRTLIAFAAAAVVAAIVALPLRALSLADDGAAKLGEQMGDLAAFLPGSRREERWFYGVSVNAGFNEELIFRGYLIWYLQHFVSLGWAAVIAVFAFAAAHAYQGPKQLPGILLVSAVGVGLYVYTGSLLVPIIFHAVLDALQGRYIAATRRSASTSS